MAFPCPSFRTAARRIALASLPCLGAVQAQPVPPAAVALEAPAAPSGVLPAVRPLPMAEAVRRALAANPDLAAVRREWEATAGALTQAGLRPNPQAAFGQEDVRNGRRAATLQFTFPIERGGKREARIAVAGRVRDQAEAGVEQYRAEVRAAVVGGYLEVLLARERLALARESLALASGSAEAAQRRVQAGKVAPVEASRARVAQAAARAELARAEGDARTTRARLSALWGGPAIAEGEVAGSLPFPSEGLPDDVVSERLRASPLLRRARLEVERWRSAVALEQARGVVDIAVSAGAKRSQETGATQAIVGLVVPIPWFDRNQGNIAEAISREYKAQDELEAAELRLATQVGQAREQLRAARSEASTLRADAVPAARSAHQAASRGFALGKFSYLEALDAQRTLIGTQAQYLRALADTYQAATELERLLGISDDTSVLLDPPTTRAVPAP